MGRIRRLSKSERMLVVILLVIFAICAIFYQSFIWMTSHPIILIPVIFLVILGILILLNKFNSPKNFTSFIKRIWRRIFGHESEEIKQLIDIIEGMKVQDIRNEEDFEKQLYQRLDAKGYDVKRQISFGSGYRIDMVVNGIGIELKVADRTKSVQDLIGQATVYRKHLNKMIIVILDVGIVQDMSELINHIEDVDREKISVVVIKGNKKQLVKQEEYTLIRKSTLS